MPERKRRHIEPLRVIVCACGKWEGVFNYLIDANEAHEAHCERAPPGDHRYAIGDLPREDTPR